MLTGSDAPANHSWIEPLMYSNGFISVPNDALMQKYFHAATGNAADVVQGGDSGSFIFTGINGTTVVLGEICCRGGIGDYFSNGITAITAAMNWLAVANGDNTIYAPQFVDLSGFTSY